MCKVNPVRLRWGGVGGVTSFPIDLLSFVQFIIYLHGVVIFEGSPLQLQVSYIFYSGNSIHLPASFDSTSNIIVLMVLSASDVLIGTNVAMHAYFPTHTDSGANRLSDYWNGVPLD